MEQAYKFIMESIVNNKIDKKTAIQLLKTLKQNEKILQDDIAITGISLKYPDALDKDQYWQNLLVGLDSINDFPKSRRDDIEAYITKHHSGQISEINFYSGAYLDDIDKFDYKFFNISPKEARLMSPAQRLFLESAWNVIEDAGYNNKKISGTKTGIYIGDAGDNNYQNLIYSFEPENVTNAIVGNMSSILPARIAHFLNLRGPAVIVNTACSSSLMAIHLACEAIKTGECDMAIAAGVKLQFNPLNNESFKIGIEASDGRTKTFDNNADGAGLGEGITCLFLKPLHKAKKEGDNIYAVIKGSAVNHDGNTIGLTAPNPLAQAEVIVQAWSNAGIDPESLSFIEAHGTATRIGDSLEIEGIKRAFESFTNKKQFCAVGSVKTNIAHLCEASGMAGIVKSALSLKYKIFPANINFNRPNKQIEFCDSPVFVNTVNRKLNSDGVIPLKCGVSSFGLSGTNVHIVLEEDIKLETCSNKSTDTPKLFSISAKNLSVLTQIVKNYICFLESFEEEIDNICYTANKGRSHFEYRLAVIAKNKTELLNKLIFINLEGINSFEDMNIFYGVHKIVSVKKESDNISEITKKEKRILDQSAKQELQEYLISENKDFLVNLCSYYVKGADIEWETMYKNKGLKIISVPHYPFEKTPCWINIPRINKNDTFSFDNMHFAMKWKICNLTEENYNSELTDKCILIFKDSIGLSENIISKLKSNKNIIIDVEIGSKYEKIKDNSFIIRQTQDDYIKLISDIGINNISKIIHFSTLNEIEEIKNIDELEILKENTYGLFYLSKAIMNLKREEDIDIILVSDYVNEVSGKEEIIKPINALMFGLGKAVRKDCIPLKCRCIDIDINTSADDILKEISSNFSNYVVAYRNEIRYIEEFSALDIDLLENSEFEIKENGTYIITGGFGGIGLEVADFISSCNITDIIFINRTKVPERNEWNDIIKSQSNSRLAQKISKIINIEETGSHIYFYSGDVSNEYELQNIVNQIRQKHKKIHAIFHGAGISEDEVITQKSEDKFKQIMKPKVNGTWLLDKLTSELNMEFFIMFSSVATMFPSIGQSDYVAANSYMDSYSYYLNRRGKKSLTVNWVSWKETGMAADSNNVADTIFNVLLTKDAINNLHFALLKNIKRTLIGKLNYEGGGINLLYNSEVHIEEKLKRTIELYKTKSINKLKSSKSLTFSGKVKLSGRNSGMYSQTEIELSLIWGENLGYEELDISDPYYMLGGDSIIGMKIAKQISDVMKIPLTVVELLKYQTIESLSKFIDDNMKNEVSNCSYVYPPIEAVEEQEYYPASSAQKRMFIVNKIEGNTTSYNVSKFLIVDGDFDIDTFKNVITSLVERHEILRTYFKLLNGEIIQKICKNIDVNIAFYRAKENEVDNIVKSFVMPFNLENPPLFRFGIIEVSKNKHIMMMDFHHSITDGFSMDIFNKEFIKLYKGEKLPKLKIQYKDFSIWQNKLIQSGFFDKQKEYWLNQYKDGVPILNLPLDFIRPSVKTVEGAKAFRFADQNLTEKISCFAANTETTVYMVLLSLYFILLSKCTVQDDIVVGTPITGRTMPILESIIGVFVNTLAIRGKIKYDYTFKEFLSQVKENAINAYENQDYQFEELVKELRLAKKINNSALFNNMFVMQNLSSKLESIDEFKWSTYEIERDTSMFDLMFEVILKDNEIMFNLIYCTKLFKHETIETMLDDYMFLLNNVETYLNMNIRDIKLKNSMELQIDMDYEEDGIFNF